MPSPFSSRASRVLKTWPRANRRLAIVPTWIASFCFLAACAGCTRHDSPHLNWQQLTDDSAVPVSGKLQLTGSSTLGPLVLEIARRFEQQQPSVRIEVQTGGSSRGIADVQSGLADIGMSSRGLSKSEKLNRRSWPIAWDGVSFLVNAANPVTQLSSQQLQAVLKGEIDNWQVAGGKDAPITVINRAAGRSEVGLVAEYLGMRPAEIRADLIAGENQQAIKMVAADLHAITYLSLGAAEFAAEAGLAVKSLALEGVAAEVTQVASGQYPLSRPLILVTAAEPSELARLFIKFAQSQNAHDLVRELDYVPIQR